MARKPLAALALLLCAGLGRAQDTDPDRYEALRDRAARDGKPFVVWVGQPAHDVRGCVTARWDGYPGKPSPGVVVGLPAPRGGLEVGFVIDGRATSAAVRDKLTKSRKGPTSVSVRVPSAPGGDDPGPAFARLPWPRQRPEPEDCPWPTPQEVEAHLPRYVAFPGGGGWDIGNHYRFPDAATWAHESLHALKAAADIKYPGRDCFYLGGDEVLACRPVRGTIEGVAGMVPAAFRAGHRYQVYLVNAPRQQPPLAARPGYVWDEWAAYCVGARAFREQGREDGDLGLAPFEMLPYGLAVGLAYDLDAGQRGVLKELIRATCKYGDRRSGPARQLLRPEGKPYRDLVRKLYGDTLTLEGLLED